MVQRVNKRKKNWLVSDSCAKKICNFGWVVFFRGRLSALGVQSTERYRRLKDQLDRLDAGIVESWKGSAKEKMGSLDLYQISISSSAWITQLD